MSKLTNIKPAKPTPAQIKRHAAQARLLASLTPRKQGGMNQPINIGPLNVRRATGVMGTI
ncbi:MAG: hypothetical protein Q7T78_17135 [Rhodoferax sp.]|nr:hypothetical protein [Rhodoferax sp.]